MRMIDFLKVNNQHLPKVRNGLVAVIARYKDPLFDRNSSCDSSYSYKIQYWSDEKIKEGFYNYSSNGTYSEFVEKLHIN